jgi:hypothetical protein
VVTTSTGLFVVSRELKAAAPEEPPLSVNP